MHARTTGAILMISGRVPTTTAIFTPPIPREQGQRLADGAQDLHLALADALAVVQHETELAHPDAERPEPQQQIHHRLEAARRAQLLPVDPPRALEHRDPVGPEAAGVV